MTSSQRDMFGSPAQKPKRAKTPVPAVARPVAAPLSTKLTPRQQQQRDAAMASERAEREQARVGDVRLSDFFTCELHGEPLHERLAEILPGGSKTWVKVKLTCANCLKF